MIHKARHDYIGFFYLYGGALLVLIMLLMFAVPKIQKQTGIVAPRETKEQRAVIFSSDAFSNIDVQAKAYVVYDLVNKRIIAAKNENEQLPLASVTKIMTTYTALSEHAATTTIVVTPAVFEGKKYDLGLKRGQKWSLKELLKYMLVFSSNEAAHQIADTLGGKGGRVAFVKEMNAMSDKLGLGMSFTDSAGLDINGNIGGRGSALDVAKLFSLARLQFPDVLDATTKPKATVRSSTGIVTGVPNTNQDIGNLIGAEASKTGFTDMAGGNLAVIVDVALGHPVVIVVLGSTRSDRFSDVETLYRALLFSTSGGSTDNYTQEGKGK